MTLFDLISDLETLDAATVADPGQYVDGTVFCPITTAAIRRGYLTVVDVLVGVHANSEAILAAIARGYGVSDTALLTLFEAYDSYKEPYPLSVDQRRAAIAFLIATVRSMAAPPVGAA